MQAVRARNRGARVVDELGLHALPALQVAVARRLRERPDLEPLPALFACLQLGLGVAFRLRRADRAVVFGAELLLQLPVRLRATACQTTRASTATTATAINTQHPSGHE